MMLEELVPDYNLPERVRVLGCVEGYGSEGRFLLLQAPNHRVLLDASAIGAAASVLQTGNWVTVIGYPRVVNIDIGKRMVEIEVAIVCESNGIDLARYKRDLELRRKAGNA